MFILYMYLCNSFTGKEIVLEFNFINKIIYICNQFITQQFNCLIVKNRLPYYKCSVE